MRGSGRQSRDVVPVRNPGEGGANGSIVAETDSAPQFFDPNFSTGLKPKVIQENTEI